MKNLNEQINRIKSLMLIKEQCGGDYPQCEEDLEDEGYKVFSPAELSSSCENNEVIKNVKTVLDDNRLSGKYTISSAGESTLDCYVLVKGTNKESGRVRFHFTFYADGQVVISQQLNSQNNADKILYRGKYECDGSTLKILGGRDFKYIGIKSSGGANFENKVYLNTSGAEIHPTATQMDDWGVTDPLKYSGVLSYYLNVNSILSNINVLSDGLNTTEIKKIINH